MVFGRKNPGRKNHCLLRLAFSRPFLPAIEENGRFLFHFPLWPMQLSHAATQQNVDFVMNSLTGGD